MDLQPLVEELRARRIRTAEELQRAKVEMGRRHGWPSIPSNGALLELLAPMERAALLPLLRVKRVRTASGIVLVGAMTRPLACPHGRCTFCPGGPDVGTPQSYVATEPAVRRALQLGYDPRRQVEERLRQLHAMGHATDKVELIVLGGTFTAQPWDYNRAFVQGCFEALNGATASDLAEAHRVNETATHRCVGFTVETKPDCLLGPEVEECLRLGITRIEIGIQSIHDDVLEASHRGHTAAQGREATARARGVGLKVGHHIMLGLPRSNAARDRASMAALVEDSAYRPDLLKIYPTLVMEGTSLWTHWSLGEYREMAIDEVVDVIADFKRRVPPWMRIHRVQREFTAHDIQAGVRRGDLRNLVALAMADRGWRCRCLRCREVGLRAPPGELEPTGVRRDYVAAGGREVFLSLEDLSQDVVLGYLRLRLEPSGSTFVREMRVHGEALPLGSSARGGWQHRGVGRRLLRWAMELARGDGRDAMAITSGVGVREYYRRFAHREGLVTTLDPRGHVVMAL